MPNWCNNKLVVEGDPETLAKFASKAKAVDTDLSLGSFRPTPEFFMIDDSDGWYHWRVKHWGTKWDVTAELVEQTERALIYRFESAWEPPVAWLKWVAKRWPSLRFTLNYVEPEMEFKGVARGGKGTVTDKREAYRNEG